MARRKWMSVAILAPVTTEAATPVTKNQGPLSLLTLGSFLPPLFQSIPDENEDEMEEGLDAMNTGLVSVPTSVSTFHAS